MKYNLNGRVFVQTKDVGWFDIWIKAEHIILEESELLALGATPVDSVSEEKHPTGECEHNSGREYLDAGGNMRCMECNKIVWNKSSPKQDEVREQVVLNNIDELDEFDVVDANVLATNVNMIIRNQKAIISAINKLQRGE